MTQLFLPAPGILANSKPDFPVERNTENQAFPPLLYYFAQTEGGGQFRDLITGTLSTQAGQWATSPHGRTLKYNGTTDYSQVQVNLSGTSKITLAFWMLFDSYANADKLAMEMSTNYGGNLGTFLVDPDSGAPASGFFQVALHTGANFPYSYFPRASAGVWHHYIIEFDGSVSTVNIVPAVYVDGVAQTVTNNTVLNSPGTFGNWPLYLMSRAGASLFAGGQQDHIQIFNGLLTAQQAAQLYKNSYQLLRPKQRDLYLVVNTGTANNLTGTSTESQSATGSATIGINMVAASVQQQSGTGAVTVSAQLSGIATATQQANGNLQVSIPLNGSTIAKAIATGSLAIGANLSGTTQQTQSGTGSLNISITLSGTEIQQAYASGTLTNTAAGAVALAGESDQAQTASGILSIGDNLSGASLAISSATGNLTTLVPLAGASVQAQLASGGLTVTAAGANLSGAAIQDQLATGTLTLRVNLNAQSVQTALNTGYLTSAGTLVAHPTKWHIVATKRIWNIPATKRTWLIA